MDQPGCCLTDLKESPTWTGNVCHDDVLEESREVELDVARLDALRLDHLLRRAQRQHHRLVDLPPLQREGVQG